MSAYKHVAFLDTNSMGLSIPIEHNLPATPSFFITEKVGGETVYVSLMDPRIAEIKVVDKNVVSIVFAAAFQGYMTLEAVVTDRPSDHDRLLVLEEKISNQLALIESKASLDKLTQIASLFSGQISNLQDQINDLQSQINSIKDDLSRL